MAARVQLLPRCSEKKNNETENVLKLDVMGYQIGLDSLIYLDLIPIRIPNRPRGPFGYRNKYTADLKGRNYTAFPKNNVRECSI